MDILFVFVEKIRKTSKRKTSSVAKRNERPNVQTSKRKTSSAAKRNERPNVQTPKRKKTELYFHLLILIRYLWGSFKINKKMIETSQIIKVLSTVLDPISGQNLIERSMVRDLTIEGNKVQFKLELTSVNTPNKTELNFACIEAIQKVYPMADVHVHMMGKNADVTAKENTSSVPQIKNIIAVASGKGGVGKSTIAVNLALALKKTGAKVGLIDADLYGPSIPTMLGLQGQKPKIQDVYGKSKIVPLEVHGMPVMSIGFIIEPEQAVVLRGPRLGAIITQFFKDTIWMELDYLVVDLPPGTGDIQLSLVQTVPVTGAIMVTTPQDVATDDATKAMNMFLLPSVNVPILGVVENMSWFTPKELPDNKYYIFGQGGGEKLVEKSNSVLLGQIPIIQGIREAGDSGNPAVMQEDAVMKKYFTDLAANTIKQIEIRNNKKDATKIVEITHR